MERIRLDGFCEQEGLSYDFREEGYTILDILDANVSGRDFEQGKPHPERDRQALLDAGRWVIRLRLSRDVSGGLSRLADGL